MLQVEIINGDLILYAGYSCIGQNKHLYHYHLYLRGYINMVILYQQLATILGVTITGLLLSCSLFGKKRKHKRSSKARKATTPEDVSLSRHSNNVAKSTILVSKIREIEQNGVKINYLRKIDPYVFL
jgi:hypothetical protein